MRRSIFFWGGEEHARSCPTTLCVSCAKMAKPIEIPFGLWTRVGGRKHMLHRAHWRHLENAIEPTYEAVMRPYVKLLCPLVMGGGLLKRKPHVVDIRKRTKSLNAHIEWVTKAQTVICKSTNLRATHVIRLLLDRIAVLRSVGRGLGPSIGWVGLGWLSSD